MEENKNNKGLIVLIIILIIMVLGLGSYIVYDKIISNKSTETNESNNTKANEGNKEEKTMSESEALTLGNELWKYAYSTYWGTEPAWSKHVSDTVNEHGGRENICDTKVEDVKKKYASDFEVQSWLSDDTTCASYTVKDFVPSEACRGAGRGSLQNYKETTLTVKSIQDNKIVFIAKSEYCGSSFCHESNETVKEIEKDFVIVKQNDNWLISNFYLPN